MTQPDIYDLLAEESAEDLVVVMVRDAATGFVQPWAGRVVSEPMARDDAERIRSATPNGQQMEIVPAAVCPQCNRRHSIQDTTVAGSRWAHPYRYRARFDGSPVRDTRELAIQDMCNHRTTTTEGNAR